MMNKIAELIVIPAPMIGHLIPTMEMAKLLVKRDPHLYITVINLFLPCNSRSELAVNTYLNSFSTDRISITEVPQSKSPVFSRKLFNQSCRKYVRDVVSDMMSRHGVAGFVIDMCCTGLMDVAKELNIPTYVFFTSNAAFLGFKLYIKTLCDDQNIVEVLKLTNSDSVIQVPSFVNPVHTKVFPSQVQINKASLESFLMSARKLKDAKAIMVNTFLELETHAIESLSSDISIPQVYPVGPMLNIIVEGGELDDDVITWLDTQPSSSVVLLCFGSRGYFDEVQVKEIAHALERSGRRFLWSLRQLPRSDKPFRNTDDYEDPGVVLPKGFLERTSGIGKVIGWAPQVELLAHGAIGGFVSHCGWNSLL